jgi:CheY-like chemotaxis protein
MESQNQICKKTAGQTQKSGKSKYISAPLQYVRSTPYKFFTDDYHLDEGNGIDVIVALRRHCGLLPAILVTADRSPAVRERARAQDIQLLHKPLKPAALRALLAQWQIFRAAAE